MILPPWRDAAQKLGFSGVYGAEALGPVLIAGAGTGTGEYTLVWATHLVLTGTVHLMLTFTRRAAGAESRARARAHRDL